MQGERRVRPVEARSGARPGGSALASGPSGAWRAIPLCFAVALLEGYDIQALGVAAPRLARELDVPPGQLGSLFATGNLGIVIGAAVGGRWADRVGRKPVFVTAVAAFGLFTLATALAFDFATLLCARGMTGLGLGAALPGMMAIAAEISAPGRRTSTATLMFCGMPLGGAAVAWLMGSLPAGIDWRVVFLLGGVLPLIVAGAIVLWMEAGAHALAPAGLRGGVAASLFGQGRAPSTLLLWSAFLPTFLVLYLILNWLPTLLSANGLDAAVAARSAATFNLGAAAGALVLGRIVDRIGFAFPLGSACGLLIVVLGALATALDPVAVQMLAAATGFLLVGAQYSLYGVAPACYPDFARGTGSGAATAVGRLGSILGPFAAGPILAAGATPSAVLLGLVPVAMIACAAIVALGMRERSA